MKNAFADEVHRLAENDPRLVILCASDEDGLFSRFRESHPGRYYNTQYAETSTVSLAAGLARSGLIPVCYAPAASLATRAFAQIQQELSGRNEPVILVGTDCGFAAAAQGSAYQALHDIALMRSLPDLRVLSPADPMELRSCLRAAVDEKGPTYLRIGRKGESAFFPERPTFSLGVWKQVRAGSRVTLLVTGNLLPVVAKAADLLEKTSLCPRVCSCASIKPLDTAALLRYFSRDELVVTVEEHALAGGFGSAVAEWLADNHTRQQARLLRLGVADTAGLLSGDQAHAREACELTPGAIANAVSTYLGYR